MIFQNEVIRVVPGPGRAQAVERDSIHKRFNIPAALVIGLARPFARALREPRE